MSSHTFHEVDVFASGPRSGNPLAVVHDAEEVDETAMQEFAAWTNFSETTFLLPPTDDAADYRVRIFTPTAELPFAGHPTIGSAAAWHVAGGVPSERGRVVQECGVGLVELRHEDGVWSFGAPELIRSGPLDDEMVRQTVRDLDLDPSTVVGAVWADNGPGWRALRLRSADDVLAVRLPARGRDDFFVGLVGFHPAGSDCAIEVRAFFPDASGSIREDPVTGSLNASLAQWLLGDGTIAGPYVAAQGTRLGRAGRVHVSPDDDGTIWVGGRAPITVAGTVTL